MIKRMFKAKTHQKASLRKVNQAKVNPVIEQVRRMLTDADQKLILMVRG